MSWRIGAFTFDEATQSLSSQMATIQIEPLQSEVLSYFCMHPNEIVTRDELIEAAWSSRVVTDNAVNRVIARLRKVLGDDVKFPQYIQTLPKKGYRFVAHIEVVETKSLHPSAHPHRTTPKMFIWASAAVFAMIALGSLVYAPPSVGPSTSGLEFLTRGGGQEFHPAVSRSGKYLAFSTFVDDQMRMFLKDLETQSTVQISDDDGFSGPASFSDRGDQLVYLYTNGSVCQLRQLSLDELEITASKVVHNCPENSFGKVIFTHDDGRLIYAESKKSGSPYEIFELNTKTSSRRRLAQPSLVLGGNSEFDLHPQRNELLISSPDEQQWLSIYSLNLDTDELDYLFKLDEWVCCARWSHDGSHVVLMSEHPAHQIVSYDLRGENRTVIHSSPHRISSLARHGNQRDYVYVGGTVDRDIVAYSLVEDVQHKVVDSSVDDRLVTLSPDAKTLAYVSDRSGSDEIWLYHTDTTLNQKMTSLRATHRYFDLQWAPDGTHLAASTINGIHVFDTHDGNRRVLDIPQSEYRGLSWKSKHEVSYSVNTGLGWQVQHYNIVDNAVSIADKAWAYIRYSPNPDDILWVADSGEVYYGNNHRGILESDAEPIVGRRFNLIKNGPSIYYYEYEAPRWNLHAKRIDPASSKPRLILSSESLGAFAVYENLLVTSQVSSHMADIYRTGFNDP